MGPWLLWFAVLGGALAWAFHLLFAWGVAELACMNGETEVIGLPLRGFVGLATGVPLAVALAATGLAWRVWRAPADPDGDRSGHDASTPHSDRSAHDAAAPHSDRSAHDASAPHSVPGGRPTADQGRGGRPASDQGDRSVERARFLAQVGFALDLFAVAATIFGAAALIVLEPCAR